MKCNYRFCESCMWACPWDYEFKTIMCSYSFEEKEPFDRCCDNYIESQDNARQLVLTKYAGGQKSALEDLEDINSSGINSVLHN